MTHALNPALLKRYKDIARLFIKYGRGDLVSGSTLDSILVEAGEDEETPHAERVAAAEELADDLEDLGPTFVKLGQLLASRSDLLPPTYLEALSRLQDDVEPFAFEEVERIVTEELGVRLSKAFDSFESDPYASASLGQVHRATLRDGRRVVVKVQRPDVRKQAALDLEALANLAELADQHTDVGRRYQFVAIVEEFRKTLIGELDYLQEASNLTTIGAHLADFEDLFVPQPVADYTTSRVLTMEYVEGSRIDELSPAVLIDVDGKQLADALFKAYLKQVLVDGLFHADPHQGNLLLTPEHRLALLDLGMVGHIGPEMQESLLHVLLALSEGKGEEVAKQTIRMSEVVDGADVETFTSEVTDLVVRHREASLEKIESGRVVMQVARIGSSHGVRVPPMLTLLGKALLNLDPIGRALDPKFNPNEAIQRHASDLMSQRMDRSLSLSNVISSLLDAKDLVESLPGRLNQILETIAENKLKVEVDAIDEHELIVGLQKIANRITVGLILAALIVGAALLMRVDTEFTLFGYPGLAIVLFLIAAAGGLFLVWNILMSDREEKPRGSR